MIQSVTVTNFHGEEIVLELAKPGKTGFLIADIDGISPGSCNLNIQDVATMDGGLYTGGHVPTRSINMSIIFMGDYTIEDLRHKCYKFFPIKKKVKLTFQTDTRLAYIEGYVESHDVDIFSDMETATITILCPDPFFKDFNSDTMVFLGADPRFEFPFSNESLDQPLIVFGDAGNKYEHHVFYKGDYDTGTIFNIEIPPFDSLAGKLTIYNSTTMNYGDGTGKMVIDLDTVKEIASQTIAGMLDLMSGYTISISSIRGSKHLQLITQAGKKYSALNAIDRQNSSWIYLVPGENVILVDHPNKDILNLLSFSIYADVLYGGV